MIELKSDREYAIIKNASRILSEVFDEVEKILEPGLSTIELDRKVETAIKKRGAIPAFKNYHGFPNAVCISLNEEVVHGIPSERVMKAGDIASVDIGVKYDGYYADAARTYPIGEINDVARQLIAVTRESLFYALDCIKTGMRLGNLSYAIQTFVERNGFSVVREYVGHGIGTKLHEDPQVPNFGKPGTGIVLDPGLVLAIEPMVNEGGWKTEVLANKWTVVTKDRLLSAHHEETIFFGSDGPEVLTRQ